MSGPDTTLSFLGVDPEGIEAVLGTAMSGGWSWWASFGPADERDYERVRKLTPKPEGTDAVFGQLAWYMAHRGVVVELVEDRTEQGEDNQRYTVTRAAIAGAMVACAQRRGMTIEAFSDPGYLDINSADWVLQHATFGEERYA